MKRKKWKGTQLAADFETYVSEQQEQTETEVWSAAYIDLAADNDPLKVVQLSSIDDFMSALFSIKGNVKVYFHNEKFDGTFILTWLFKSKYKPYTATAHLPDGQEAEVLKTVNRENPLPCGYFTYMIAKKGQWYRIQISDNGRTIDIVDSAKIAPMSLAKLGKDFKTPHQKLEMEYTGERHAGYTPSTEELAYIRNDVLVLKEVLNDLQANGLDGLTIGSICLKEFKSTLEGNRKYAFRNNYPDLCDLLYTQTGMTVDEYIRRSYHGGWCYCKKNGTEHHTDALSTDERKAYEEYSNIINDNKEPSIPVREYGMTFDVNSLYPSMMQSESGNVYPYGLPQYGDDIDQFNTISQQSKRFYFVRFKARFKLKPRKLPSIQIKSSMLYNPKQWLETSDVVLEDGTVQPEVLEMTMAKPDFELFIENYYIDPDSFEFIDFIWFKAKTGMFDKYINYWAEIKQKNKGAMRTIAKLMLNNLYGKFAASMDSSYKIAYLNTDGALRFKDIEAYDKEPGYIAIGSAITSYARCFAIRAAQANYDMFEYADTDSIHLWGLITDVKGIRVHATAFNAWKMETCWNEAVFARQKTYIERVTHEDGTPVEDITATKNKYHLNVHTDGTYDIITETKTKQCEPYYNIKCAGMGKQAKENFNKMLTSGEKTLHDFRPGLVVPGNLKAKLIKGGSLLVSSDYVMREDLF